MQFTIKILIALLPVFLFFWFYFRNFIFNRNLLWQSKAFFYGLLASTAALAIQLSLPRTQSPEIKAFIYAALVEEAVRFLFIYVRVRRSSETFTVMEGTFDGILIGLGFSFAENLHYATTFDGYVILLRCVSSVPIHAFCGGIMGFFLAYRHHLDSGIGERRFWNRLRRRYKSMSVKALMLPVLLHGLYDYVLFLGGDINYLLPILILVGFSYVEYLIARARIVLSRNILELLRVDAEDMDIIQRQIEYEKWMAETIRSDEARPKLFLNKWTPFNTVLGFLLLLFAGLTGLLMLGDLPRPFGLEPGVPFQVELSLLMLLPLSIALILIGADKVNYLFVRQHMLRLPRVSVLTIREFQADFVREPLESDTIALDVLNEGLFASAVKHLKLGQHVELEFIEARRKVTRWAVVRWVNIEEERLPLGAVLRYTDAASFGFRVYRSRYELFKLTGRLRHGFAPY